MTKKQNPKGSYKSCFFLKDFFIGIHFGKIFQRKTMSKKELSYAEEFLNVIGHPKLDVNRTAENNEFLPQLARSMPR
jgi:hypothetical protein